VARSGFLDAFSEEQFDRSSVELASFFRHLA